MGLNVNNMRLWIAALRSGEFEQGRQFLAQRVDGVEKYCCLGVACEIAIRSGVELARDAVSDKRIRYYDSDGDMGFTSFLPPVVYKWLGLEHWDPWLMDSSGNNYPTSNWNDGKGASFLQIADMLEAMVQAHEEQGTADEAA